MIKILIHSIIFILTIVVIFFIVFISPVAFKTANQTDVKNISPSVDPSIIELESISPATSKPENQTDVKNISPSVDPSIIELESKWPGLGMGLYNTQVDGYVDTLLANGFNDLRIDIPDYQDTAWLTSSKAAVIRAIAKGAKVVWGVSSNSFNNPSYTITSSNWPAFRQAILDNARWAQDNGVYEYQLGNEEEFHVDGKTMTVEQIIINLKSVAADAQSIFTRGKISYSCAHYFISSWISAGKGDIDILASNIYMGYDNIKGDLWKTEIDALVNSFGINGTYLTEFGLNAGGLTKYSTNEVRQAIGLKKMLDYIEASGITRAFWYTLKNDTFGALKDDGTYRLLWKVLVAYNNR